MRNQKGYTLVELLMVVAIIAIMTTIWIGHKPGTKWFAPRPPAETPARVEIGDTMVSDPEGIRFTVKRVATFSDRSSYYGERSIYLLADAKTGREYVGISGIGISEVGSHLVGKIIHEDER